MEGDAGMTNSQIITSGIAGLFGGAISMAIGEYVSVKAQSDATSAEINEHRKRLSNDWDEEMVLLRQKLESVLSQNTIDCIIEDLKKSKGGINKTKNGKIGHENNRENDGFDGVLEFYSKLVLGVDPEDVNGDNIAYKSAMYSFGMFSFGALIPLSPYFWFKNTNVACIMAIITSLVIAIIIGLAIAYFSHSDQRIAMKRQFVATLLGVSLSIMVSKVFDY